MDPVTAVGLVTSILQLVVAAKSVIDLGRDVVNAPKEQRALFREVQNLEPLLTDLQRRLLLPGSESINGLQQLKDPLLDFKETMDRIAGRLRSVNESGSKLPKALSWTLWNKNEAEADMAKIERFVTLLNVWLGLDIWWVPSTMAADVFCLHKFLLGINSKGTTKVRSIWVSPAKE
jgi:hypothetical protein